MEIIFLRNCNQGLLDLCLEFGAVNDDCGHIALWQQDWDAFEWLVSHGLFSWGKASFQLHKFPIPIETFEELKRRGFDFHIVNEKGQNLFFLSIPSVFFQFLIEEGVDPNVVKVDGIEVWPEPFPGRKRQALVVIGACPQLDQGFLDYAQCEGQLLESLPDCADIWATTTGVAVAARLRLLAISALLHFNESLIVDINQHYPLVLWAAAIVVDQGVETLRAFGINIDFDELQTVLAEKRFTYLANRCREEKMRVSISLDHFQLL